MPRIRLTKSAIDALPTSKSDVVYWDAGYPGFGVKVTPKGRKVFIVLYRTGGAGSKLRKYTIGPYGRVTLHQARVAAQRVFAAKLEGRDPAGEKREAKRRVVADRVEDLLETFVAQRLSQNRSGGEIARLLRREVGKRWAGSSIHEISKRDVVEVVTAIEQRGAPVAANKALKAIKPVYSGQNWISHNEFGRSRGPGPRTRRLTLYTCPSKPWLCWHGQTSRGRMSFLCSEPSPSRNSVEQNAGWISSRE
jgi:hypothetical protein